MSLPNRHPAAVGTLTCLSKATSAGCGRGRNLGVGSHVRLRRNNACSGSFPGSVRLDARVNKSCVAKVVGEILSLRHPKWAAVDQRNGSFDPI